MSLLLIILFLVTALLYASVGFGGGSTYNALLVLQGADYRILPAIALICNIIVVTGGVWRFWQAGHLPLRRLAPWIIASLPAAWIGGRIPISELQFIGVLGFSLLGAGLHLAFGERKGNAGAEIKTTPPLLAGAAGAGLGLISGLAGIGGGVFLAPLLYMQRWGSPKEIAGACSFFILVNSAAGLAGQMMKLNDTGAMTLIAPYWLLFAAVLIGGQIGSRLGAVGLPSQTIRRLTAILILYVSMRLLFRWFTSIF